MKPYLFLFLLVFLQVCGKRSSDQEYMDDRTDEEVNHLTPSLLSELQGDWEKLTQWQDGSWVVFRPCDADNLSITVNTDTLVIGWGQDASYAIVEEIVEDEVPGRYVVTVRDPESDEPLTYFFEWDNHEHTLVRWWLWGLEQPPDLLARLDILDQYKEFKQPCHECWDDCEE
ncbi:MAG: hypothetical protein N2044_07170 [Cyclobacteriaceae bacterium]|nr:hypothetical protein [Cyclobacteriaceae bacterium]MCX7637606.1 hypothetical protein [Cyclobacteriaceae bacterium]MDW8330733.1 hypothetical protein [Cyclobacteriaceae bacterium]